MYDRKRKCYNNKVNEKHIPHPTKNNNRNNKAQTPAQGAAIISQNVCKFWNDRIISFLLVFYNDIVQYELVLCGTDQFDSVMMCVLYTYTLMCMVFPSSSPK